MKRTQLKLALILSLSIFFSLILIIFIFIYIHTKRQISNIRTSEKAAKNNKPVKPNNLFIFEDILPTIQPAKLYIPDIILQPPLIHHSYISRKNDDNDDGRIHLLSSLFTLTNVFIQIKIWISMNTYYHYQIHQ